MPPISRMIGSGSLGVDLDASTESIRPVGVIDDMSPFLTTTSWKSSKTELVEGFTTRTLRRIRVGGEGRIQGFTANLGSLAEAFSPKVALLLPNKWNVQRVSGFVWGTWKVCHVQQGGSCVGTVAVDTSVKVDHKSMGGLDKVGTKGLPTRR